MGGRSERKYDNDFSDRELWIHDVSDSRLDKYLRMLESDAWQRRSDGTPRAHQGKGKTYFNDLIQREKNRRSKA